MAMRQRWRTVRSPFDLFPASLVVFVQKVANSFKQAQILARDVTGVRVTRARKRGKSGAHRFGCSESYLYAN
ncbi:hypothetical protein HNQ60_004366 [Povalibacter uvarum]|uniref:Uncharacterized protein n=1 Tax=Povalibacter uvarum TaxID=732238 RepID=A0A841HRF2_9GAMM|nr:hypothetical protein [Povalibacter uvarum]